jgi:hypothetical protein
MWKKAAVAYFTVITNHLPGGIEENNEKTQSG